ncbi:MAG: DNA/RNA nuclease SfsA [Candidatus Heimdallarchaeota archaeon]|nr:DNA/RNA nuclease SfsA [Candidatus Heimdallarchaeota archaeon]MBY8993521.1 DNA/RNA nuclease SfsA [Candidatus Heimdallarchaeota archaeon]
MLNREIVVDGKVRYATFINRPNRFLVNLKPEGSDRVEKAFLHDPGRMKELLIPNAQLIIREPLSNKDRKTKWDILAVEFENKIVTINSSLPNRVAKQAIKNKWINELADYIEIKAEVNYGNSRLDFLLTNDKENCYVEVKGVTLVKGKKALFPDAPTKRGARHLRELIDIKSTGSRAIVLFICMRDDPIVFSPNEVTDSEFSDQLRDALSKGVEVLVYTVKPIIKNEKLVLQFKNKIALEIEKDQ